MSGWLHGEQLDPEGCFEQATFSKHPVGHSPSQRVDVHGRSITVEIFFLS
jgi:hypothetical protein